MFGTILPDKLNSLLVKGIQYEGIVLSDDYPSILQAYYNYHTKHPLALAITGKMWTIQLNLVKMTDSTAGFGKKIIWNRKK